MAYRVTEISTDTNVMLTYSEATQVFWQGIPVYGIYLEDDAEGLIEFATDLNRFEHFASNEDAFKFLTETNK